MVKTTYNSTQDLIDKLQNLRGKTKLKFYQNISNFHDERDIRRQSGKFQFIEDPFSKNPEIISKLFHEVLLLLKLLQTKRQIKSMKSNSSELFYTVNKKRVGKQFVNDEFENIEND